MATKKQLENLKKGREALAKKRAAGTVKKKKTVAKKSPVKKAVKKKTTVRKTTPKYIVEIKLANGKIGYLKARGADTEKSNAQQLTLKSAETKATTFFNRYKSALKQVRVIPVKKS